LALSQRTHSGNIAVELCIETSYGMSSNLYIGLDTPPSYYKCLELFGRYFCGPSIGKGSPVDADTACLQDIDASDAQEAIQTQTRTPSQKGRKEENRIPK
jgi:hypothetical protein